MDEGVKLLGKPDTPSEESRVLAQESDIRLKISGTNLANT